MDLTGFHLTGGRRLRLPPGTRIEAAVSSSSRADPAALGRVWPDERVGRLSTNLPNTRGTLRLVNETAGVCSR
jgi:hypothetical protein